jgi:oligopeptide/dipeptide ABC transporter ATP-binding protein
MPLLSIQNLTVEFGPANASIRVVDDLSLEVEQGETVCLVGESGSGKSVTALSIARLLSPSQVRYPAGQILVKERDVLRMTAAELRSVRGGIVSYVFQEPGASLNPVYRIGSQIKETLRLHCPHVATDEEVIRLLTLVGISDPRSRMKSFPHELSGGMQQRVVIAMAIAPRPRLLVADEPTTALDVTIQAQIIELLTELRSALGMSILLITHNLGLVGDIADRLAVMYAGQIVEMGRALEVLQNPAHPYTRALLRSVPEIGSLKPKLESIPGNVPNPGSFPRGCHFHPRCTQARPDCSVNIPVLESAGRERLVRCPYWQAGPE